MKLSGERAKDKVVQLASMLPIGKQVTLSFSKHTDTAKLVSCTLATQAGIKEKEGNVPDKRRGENDKEITPATVTLEFNNGTPYWFHIVLDDIDIYQKIGGAELRLPSCTMTIMEIKE